MIIEIVMSILFQPVCFSSSGSDHFNICKITSGFPNVVCFIRLQVAFVFQPSHPFFFKDSDFLFKYPFIDGKSLHSFPSMFLSGDSQDDTNGASSLSILRHIFISSGFNANFVDHILSSFQMFSQAGAPLNHPLLAIHLF